MTGGLIAIILALLILWDRKGLVEQCKRSAAFSWLLTVAGCSVIIAVGMIYMWQNFGRLY